MISNSLGLGIAFGHRGRNGDNKNYKKNQRGGGLLFSIKEQMREDNKKEGKFLSQMHRIMRIIAFYTNLKCVFYPVGWKARAFLNVRPPFCSPLCHLLDCSRTALHHEDDLNVDAAYYPARELNTVDKCSRLVICCCNILHTNRHISFMCYLV